MRRPERPVRLAALLAISCNTCFLLAAFKCETTASGESKSAISMMSRVVKPDRTGFVARHGHDDSSAAWCNGAVGFLDDRLRRRMPFVRRGQCHAPESSFPSSDAPYSPREIPSVPW